MNKIMKTLVGIAFLFAITSCVTYTVSKTSNLAMFDVYEGTFENATTIRIKSITGDVNFKESRNGKIRVEIQATMDEHYNVGLNDKTLIVETGINLHRHENYASNITVYVPKGYDGNISVNMTTGNFYSAELENSSINLDSVTGDVNIGSVRNLNIDSTTGNVKIYSISNKAYIEITTGDIDIENANLKENSSIKVITGNVTIYNARGIFIDATTLGKINIYDNDRKSDVELEIKVTTGNITVN